MAARQVDTPACLTQMQMRTNFEGKLLNSLNKTHLTDKKK